MQDQLETNAGAHAGRDELGLAEAARVCGVPQSRIRRHRDAGDLPGAYRDARGTWRIPVPDLVAIGLHPAPASPSPSPPELDDVHRLRAEIAVLRERLAAAQLIAKERGDRIADLRVVLRMLPDAQPEPTAEPPVLWLSEAAPPAGATVRHEAVAASNGSGPAHAPATNAPAAPPEARPVRPASVDQRPPRPDGRADRAPARPVHISGWRETFEDIPSGRGGKRTHGHRRASRWSRILGRGEG